MSDDTKAIAELARLSNMDAPHAILHYVYAPNSEIGASIAGELQLHGFGIEQRPSADGSNWLVIARHEAAPSAPEIASTRSLMEALAARAGGEYDGWEVEVRR